MTDTTTNKSTHRAGTRWVESKPWEGATAMTIVHQNTDKNRTGRKWAPLTWEDDDIPSYGYHGSDPTASVALGNVMVQQIRERRMR